jgi:hypothetical protein
MINNPCRRTTALPKTPARSRHARLEHICIRPTFRLAVALPTPNDPGHVALEPFPVFVDELFVDRNDEQHCSHYRDYRTCKSLRRGKPHRCTCANMSRSVNIFHCHEPHQDGFHIGHERHRSRPIENRVWFVSEAFIYLAVSVLAMLPVVAGVMSILS